MSDRSCYVMIVNQTQQVMNLRGIPVADHGQYITNPDSVIQPGKSTFFQLGMIALYGPAGSCVYVVTDKNGSKAAVTFSYQCPLSDPNEADAVWNSPQAGDISIQMVPNPLPQYGHPVRVQFTVIQH